MTSPERTCAGCGRKAPQSELARLAARAGTLVEGRGEPGRGVYTCRRLACFERAAARRAFARVLKQTVVVDPALAHLVAPQLESGADG
ncbi:MAG: YlxR family protein [Actinobacteria bacterium]|nr:YlxR family protein [Actinomycetota bacterium]